MSCWVFCMSYSMIIMHWKRNNALEYLLKCKRQFSSWTLDPIFSHAILTTSQAKAFFFATDTSNTISGFPDCVKRNWRKRKCLMWAHANILTCSCTVLSPNDWFSPQGAILHKERSFILQMNTRLRSSLLAHIFQGPGAHSSGVLFD